MAARRIEFILAADGRQLKENLVSAEGQMKKLGLAAKRMADQLNVGSTAERQMYVVAKAVEKLGGSAKLSEGQAAQLRKEIERLSGLGAKVPDALKGLAGGPGLDKARADLSGFKAELQSLTGSLGPAGTALASIGPAGLAAAAGIAAIAVAGGAVLKFLIDATTKAVEFGSKFQDMAENTEVAASTLQLIAGSKGVGAGGLDSFAAGLKKLNNELLTAPKQFEQLGLSAQRLIAMRPEERFQAVARAILQLGTDAERSAASYALLGKSIPMSDLRDLADLTNRMGRAEGLGLKLDDATTAALKDFQDEATQLGQVWDQLWVQIGASIATAPGVTDAIRGLATALGEGITAVIDNKAAFQGLAQDVLIPTIGILGDVARSTGTVISALKGMATAAQAVLLPTTLIPRLTGETGADAARAQAFAASARQNAGVEAGREGIARMQAAMAAAMGKGGGPKWDPDAGRRAAEAAAAAEKLAAANDKVTESIEKLGLAMQKDIFAEQQRRNAEATGQLNSQLQEQLRTLFQIDALGNSTAGPSAYASPDDLKAADARRKVLDMIEAAGGREATAGAFSKEQADMLAFLDKNKGSFSDPAQYQKIRDQITGVKAETIDWGRALAGVADLFQVLGISADSALGRILGGITGVASSLAGLKKLGAGGKLFGEGGAFSTGKGGGMSTLGGKLAVGGAVGGGLAAIGQMLGGSDTTAGRSLGGAAMGAQLGAIAGPWGMAAGAVVGAVIGAFKKPSWVKVGKDAGKVLGTSISKELAQAIEATSKKLGLSTKNAALLSISGAMGESGKDPREFSNQIQDLMRGISSGSIPAAQGLEEVGKSFTAVADSAMKAKSVGDRAMVGIIKSARAMGLESEEIKAFVAGQLESAARGVAGFMASFKEGDKGAFGQGGLQITQAGIGADVDAIDPKLAQSQATIFSAVFWATVKEKGMVAAGDAMRASLDSFTKVLEELGGDAATDAILAPIRRVMDLTSDSAAFRGAAEGAEALRQALEGVANAGYLTNDAFSAFQVQARAAYDQAISGGATTAEAWMTIAPLLQSLLSASRNYGIELDDQTKAMIEQAKASGVAFKEEPIERMANAMDRAVFALEKMAGITHDVADGMRDIAGAAGEIPDEIGGTKPRPTGPGGDLPAYTAAAGVAPVRLKQDTIIHAHEGELAMIVPKGRAHGYVSAANGLPDLTLGARGTGGPAGVGGIALGGGVNVELNVSLGDILIPPGSTLSPEQVAQAWTVAWRNGTMGMAEQVAEKIATRLA